MGFVSFGVDLLLTGAPLVGFESGEELSIFFLFFFLRENLVKSF